MEFIHLLFVLQYELAKIFHIVIPECNCMRANLTFVFKI